MGIFGEKEMGRFDVFELDASRRFPVKGVASIPIRPGIFLHVILLL